MTEETNLDQTVDLDSRMAIKAALLNLPHDIHEYSPVQIAQRLVEAFHYLDTLPE